MEGQIVVSGLTKVFPRVRAVDDLSFTVEPGRVTGFLGPNGSGKTTTLRMMLNLVTPTKGVATISGERYANLHEPLGTVGAVLEASSAHKGRTGINQLRVICQAAGLPRQRADEVMALVGLTPAARATALLERSPRGRRPSAASTSTSSRERPGSDGTAPQRRRSRSTAPASNRKRLPRRTAATSPRLTARSTRGTEVPRRRATSPEVSRP